MSGFAILGLAGSLLLVSFVGSTMTLFRRSAAGQASAASPATTRTYRYRDADGRMHDLIYNDLPLQLGRWGYQTQTSPSFYFAFDLQRVGAVVRIYIAEQPPYGTRDAGLLITHRYADGDRCYICIRNGNEPVNGREAATWLIYWSEATAKYILTGERFS